MRELTGQEEMSVIFSLVCFFVVIFPRVCLTDKNSDAQRDGNLIILITYLILSLLCLCTFDITGAFGIKSELLSSDGKVGSIL